MFRARDKIIEIGRLFKEAGMDEPMREADLLVRHAIGIDPVRLYNDDPVLDTGECETLNRIVYRRLRHEPLQYIIGHVDFLGLKIHVDRGVLIPRPETEFMTESAIRYLSSLSPGFTVLDLCTGSGCIVLAIAKRFPHADLYGSDISVIALRCARRNAIINNVNNVRWIKGDLFKPIEYGMFFDLIITNPPYIRRGDIEGLQPEIRCWEPLIALDGGEDGLDYYRKIVPDACHYLKDGGLLMMEIFPDGARDIIDMLIMSGYSEVNLIKDCTNRDRIITARWRD